MTAHLFGIIFFLLQNDISPHMMLYRRRQSWWRVCIMHGYNGRHHCAKKRQMYNIINRKRNLAEKNIRPFVWQTAERYDDISRNNITYASSYRHFRNGLPGDVFFRSSSGDKPSLYARVVRVRSNRRG